MNSPQPQPAAVPIGVLLIAPSMDILGGQAVQAGRLLTNLQQESSLRVGFQPINPRLPASLRFLQRLKYVRTALTSALYNLQLLRNARKYDILHVFSAGLWSYTLWTIPAVLVSKLYGKKIIINYRDGQAEQHLSRFRTAEPTIRMADLLVAPSGFLVDVFGRHCIPARSIFNIADLTRFRYRQRRKLRPLFMTNRILEPLYNVECILRAFAIIQRRCPDATLTIAHDGVCRPSLEKLARELQLRNTRFIGRVPHSQAPELYDAADIYLTSPNIDCMPGSLLECFASGLPVIATKAGGIPYIVRDGHTGLLVEINDHQAIADCAFRLLEDEELVERLTRNALQEVRKYDWTRIRDQWVETYRELTQKRQSERSA